MATPTLATTNFTRVNACDSTTGWSNLGGGPGVSVNNDVFIQNSASLGRRIDNGTGGFALDLGVGNELDFSVGGANEGDHIFFWVNILQPSLINGMWLRLSKDASAPNAGNSLDYEIFPANPYNGGWFRAVVDPRTTPAVENGSVNHEDFYITDIRWIGFYFDMGNVGGTSPNCNIDAIDIGRGLIVTGGSTTDKITWDDIETVSTSDSNAYGLIEKKYGVFFLKGEWQFGDASNNCYFEDTDQTIVWESNYGINQATTPRTIASIAPELNKLIVVEGTGTTDVIMGSKFGTGNDATGTNGCNFQVAPVFDGVQTFLSMDFSDADITNVEFFGCKFVGVVGGYEDDISITFCSDATNGPNHEVSGCTFDQCGLVDPGRVSMQNNVFSNTGQSSKYTPFVQVTWEDNSAASFTDITSGTATRAGSDTGYALNVDNTDDAIYFGHRDKFNGVHFWALLWSDSLASPLWEYWDGTAWSTLSGVSGVNLLGDTSLPSPWPFASTYMTPKEITWTIPDDWYHTTVNSGSPLYFVRHRSTANGSSSSGNAEMLFAFAMGLENGAAMLWNSNIDIVNSSFIANADPDTGEKAHGIEHRGISPASATYVGLEFSGNDADILWSAAFSESYSAYDFSNESTTLDMDSNFKGYAQSFLTGTGAPVSSLTVKLYRTGSPTGNISAAIYAHSGTFGTSSVPTGSPLQTALNTVDASTIPTTGAYVTFFFTLDLATSTHYVFAIDFDGDNTNHIDIAVDGSSPTHPGNLAYDDVTNGWTASNSYDICYFLSEVFYTVSATVGSNPTTFTTTIEGSVKIETLISVTLTGLIASPATEVRVYDTGTTTEIDGQENVVSGSFTFTADATQFVDIVIHNVEYEYIKIENYDVPSTDASIPIQQQFDRNYNNP